jgi:hypothetical protein
VGDDRAETYLRLLAETELRRILRLLDRVGRWRDGGPDPMPLPYDQLWAVDERAPGTGSSWPAWRRARSPGYAPSCRSAAPEN